MAGGRGGGAGVLIQGACLESFFVVSDSSLSCDCTLDLGFGDPFRRSSQGIYTLLAPNPTSQALNP